MTLRSKVIHLAHAQPELRPHLLPLLKEAGEDHQAAFGPMPRGLYLPKDNPTLEQRKNTPPGLEIWTYEDDKRGIPGVVAYYALAFWGKAQKPLWNFRFRNVMDQEKKIQETIKNYEANQVRKTERKTERTQFQHGYQVGDILVSSGGYDQTNTQFYEVTAVPSLKSIVVREIAGKVSRSERGADYVVPNPGHFTGPPELKRVGPGGHIKAIWGSASKWDGKPEYQTASGWGH